MPPRSRNYEGCWTCRSRKVKCDLAKPHCNRCLKAKFKCEGYDIKLSWSDPITIDQSNALTTIHDNNGKNTSNVESYQRRNIQAVPFPKNLTFTSYGQVDAAIDLVDSSVERSLGDYRKGPFTVFQLEKRPKKRKRVPSDAIRGTSDLLPIIQHPFKRPSVAGGPSVALSLPLAVSLSLFASLAAAVSRLQIPPPKTTAGTPSTKLRQRHQLSVTGEASLYSLIHSELINYAKLTILAIKGIHFNFDEQNMLHILYPKFFPNMDSDDWEVNMGILNRLFKFSTPEPAGLQLALKSAHSSSSITVFPLFNHLLHCFKLHGSNFMRVSHPKNYWDKIIIPFIYKIFSEFLYLKLNTCSTTNAPRSADAGVSAQTLEQKTSQMKGCIVYSVLSLSAFQQQSEDADFLTLSIELRKLTITILSSHLDEYGDENENENESENENENETQTSGSAGDLEYEELLLLGIVLQLQIDNYFSVFENFDYLYGIGEYLITEKFSAQAKGDTLILTSYLIAIFNYYRVFYESTQSINGFNYSMNEQEMKEAYRDIEDDYNLIGGSESENEADEGARKKRHAKMATKPMISNLITPASDKISFTVNFRGSDDTTLDASLKRASSTKLSSYIKMVKNASSVASLEEVPSASLYAPSATASAFPYVPYPTEMGYNQFNSELVYILFGIPQSLVDVFSAVIKLTNHKNIFQQRKVFPRNFPKICAEMEDTLLTWDESKYWTLVDNDLQFILDFHKGLYHNIKSFHHSLIVYFNQLIKKLKTSTFQHHINLALDHLLQLSELNKKYATANTKQNLIVYNFKPSFWQILVCASDALDNKEREFFENIWLNDEFNDLRNYWRAKQIIYEVWKRKDDGEDITWMDMVREWEVVMSLA